MSRDNECVEHLHTHVGICMHAGYANGRADALEVIDKAIALMQEGRNTRAYAALARFRQVVDLEAHQ